MTTLAKQLTDAQILHMTMAARGLSEVDFGALLRREGLNAAQADQWRATA